MKVIKQGVWGKKITCRDCASVLQIKADDLQVKVRETDAQEFIDEFYIECPVCSRETVLKIPTLIAQEIKNKE